MPGHRSHWWKEADKWIKETWPGLPIVEIKCKEGEGRDRMMLVRGEGVPLPCNINTAFVLAREAKHRALSSSVFLHACDAMNTTIDICYFGGANPHGLPLNRDIIQIMQGFDHSKFEKIL